MKLTPKRIKEVNRLLNPGNSLKGNPKLLGFISLYISCEAVAKKFVYYMKTDKEVNTSEAYDDLRYPDIEKAAEHFGLEVQQELIKRIFKSGKGKRNSKTPRQLRNGIIHLMNSNDIKEVIQRDNELISLMKKWLEASHHLLQNHNR